MLSLASSGIRSTRPRSAATPNSGVVARSKEAQKVTPWKNYLVETKPPIGFFARPPVSPCRSQSETLFLLHLPHQPRRPSLENLSRMASRSTSNRSCHRWLRPIRAHSAGLSRPDGTGHFCFAQAAPSHFALTCEIPGFDFRGMRPLYSRHILSRGFSFFVRGSHARGERVQ